MWVRGRGFWQLRKREFLTGEEQIESSGMQLVGQGFVFMQDNDPKHTSKLCQRYNSKQRGTAHPSTDVLAGAISNLKSH